MFTHMLYLPPPPEGNLGFWDQKQGNQRNLPRKRIKDFLFPWRWVCCTHHLLHCTSPDQEYQCTWHMPMGDQWPSEVHCSAVIIRGCVTASTFGKMTNPAATLRASWELWTWASALHYKSRAQGGPHLPIPLHFVHKHRALIFQCLVGDCVTNAILRNLTDTHLQLPVTKHNTCTHNEIWKEKDNRGRIIFKISCDCWTQPLAQKRAFMAVMAT